MRLLFILLLLCALPLNAQISIRGAVSDQQNRPLAGAIIAVPSHQTGTTSDSLGRFELLICGDCTEGHSHAVEISYIGYLSQRLNISANTPQPLKIQLQEAELATVEVLAQTLNNQQNIETTREDLARNRQGTLAASLERVAGLSSMNLGVGIAKPVIRGLSGNRISVQHDGTKQEGQQWGGDHGLEIDALDVSRVQLIKGAASLRYGSDAMGGVLLINSSTAPLQTRYLAADIETLYKTNNQHIGTSAQITARRNRLWLQTRYTFQSFGDYRLPADSFTYNGYTLPIYDHSLKNTAGQEQNARLAFGYIAPHWQSQLLASIYDLDAGLFQGATGQPRAYSLQPDGDSRNRDNPRQHVSHYKISSENVFFPHRDWHLHLQAAYQLNRRKEFSYPSSHNRPSTTNNNLALALDLQTASLNAWAEYSPSTRLAHTFGIQSQAQQNASSGFEFLIPAYTSAQAGGYYLAEWRPNSKHQFSGGLRLDYNQLITNSFYQLIYTADRLNTQEIQRAKSIQRQFLNYAAGLSWAFQINASQVTRFNLGKSFRSPSINELAADGIHHGTFRHERGDSNLRAEQGYQLDASHQIQRQRWQVNISAFGNYFQNYIYLRPTARFSPLPEGGQIYQFSQNNAVFVGGELDWSAQPFRIPVKIHQAYEYVLNYNLDSRLPLPFTPPANILSEVEYEHSGKVNLFARVGHSFTLAQNRVDRNEKASPSYHLFNMGAGLQIPLKYLKINVDIQAQNILNTPYLQHISRYRRLNLPEQGRNFVFSVRLSF